MNPRPMPPCAPLELPPPQVAEAQLRLLVEQAPVIQWMTDRDLRFTIHVGNTLSSPGLGHDQWVGTLLTDVVGLEHPAVSAHRRALAGESATYEHENSGRRRESHVGPLRDAQGAVIGVVGVEFDLSAGCYRSTTDDLRNRASFEEAAARLAAIVESSDDAIISKTLDGVITSWNLAAERLFGYTSPEAVGRSITLIIPKERLDEEKEIIGRIIRGERVVHFETVRQRKNGSMVDLSLTVSPVRDFSGRIIGASKIARDISELKRGRERMDQLYALAQAEIEERKKAEARARQLNDQLETRVQQRTQSLGEKVEELNTFAYTVAHDLRSPLRALHQFSDLLLEDYGSKLDSQGRDYLDRIIRGAERMDALILDLLAYSKVARADINLVGVDVGESLQQVLAQLAPEVKNRDARIDIQGPLPPVLAEPLLLSQCFTNLLANALKFTAEGKPPHVTIRAQRCGDAVRIEVEDRGIGIALEHRDRIFHLFERLNPLATYPGTGVGLAIVKKAAERMSGRVGVESVAGKGSVFWIELRRAGP